MHRFWHLCLVMTLLTVSPYFLSESHGDHLVGWQTFNNNVAGNNNSGITDNTPDTNSTFDFSPNGSNNGGTYLSGSIGPGASGSGWDGLGQAANSDFLNGSTFGSSKNIVDYSLADGSAGARIGPFNSPNNGNGSSWKFSQQNSTNQLLGDFSVTNESDYFFKLEFFHFDARGLAAGTSPNGLEVRYLAGPGELVNVSTGTEVSDGRLFYSNTWNSTGVENVSQGIAGVINSAARIAPGEKASFRFLWTGATGNGQAQLDNIAFSGIFQDQDNGFAEIDPVSINSVPEPTTGIVLVAGLSLIALRRRR